MNSVFRVKMWTRSCFVHRIKKISGFKSFHSGEQIQKVADSYAEFTRYVWTEAVSRKKTLLIQKYPDSCGPGLSSRPDRSNDDLVCFGASRT